MKHSHEKFTDSNAYQDAKAKIVGFEYWGFALPSYKIGKLKEEKAWSAGFGRMKSIQEMITYLWFQRQHEKCSDSEDKIALPLWLAGTY